LFTLWWRCHGSARIITAALAPAVASLLDPLGQGLPFLQAAIDPLAGARQAGLILLAHKVPGGRFPPSYSLERVRTDSGASPMHRQANATSRRDLAA
jgi:hypothetical protein